MEEENMVSIQQKSQFKSSAICWIQYLELNTMNNKYIWEANKANTFDVITVTMFFSCIFIVEHFKKYRKSSLWSLRIWALLYVLIWNVLQPYC